MECKRKNPEATTEVNEDFLNQPIPEVSILNSDEIEREESDILYDMILDFSLSQENRITALNKYFELEGYNTIELVNKMTTMYRMSSSKLLKEFMLHICDNNLLTVLLQTFMVKELCLHDCEEGEEKENTECFAMLNKVYPRCDSTIGTPVRIELLKILMRHENFIENCVNYLAEIINNNRFNCDYRYKVILGLENTQNGNHCIYPLCLEFLRNTNNEIRYRILSAQYLLQNCEITNEEREEIENSVLVVCEDEKVDYNVRADATDLLLSLGSEEKKALARTIIRNLGDIDGRARTIYQDAQNVHNQEVEDSIQEMLDSLTEIRIYESEGKMVDFDHIKRDIHNKVMEMKKDDEMDLVDLALNRIFMDRVLYGRSHYTLLKVLLKIWSFVERHESKDEMKKRMVEELCDMAETCSSGFLGRLLNVISGFSVKSIRISWADQITANLNGRLNARIRDIEDEEYQTKVLEEMSELTAEYKNRLNFSRFLRENLLSIREEMWREFEPHISTEDFDLYFRRAVMDYEGVR